MASGEERAEQPFVRTPPLSRSASKEPPRRTIKTALLSAAGRPTALDSATRPKALLDIEGSTLLWHVIRQLHVGGITHVVVVVSHHGEATVEEIDDIRQTLPALKVEVVNLGPDYQGFYARSILAARSHCFLDADEPGILIATTDHIFDESLVAELCRSELVPMQTEVSVLVDFSTGSFKGLPETTVGVRCNDAMRVTELSRALARPIVSGARRDAGMGIEAGLFASTRALFDRLAALCETRDYFTLTDAVQELAEAGLVTSLATRGRKWVAVETTEELQESRMKPVPSSSHSLAPSMEPSPGSESPAFFREPVPVIFIAGDSERSH